MRNTDQKVDTKKYAEAFEAVFGPSEKKVESGSFMYDAETRQTVKVERRRVMKSDMDPIVESIRHIDPIQVTRKVAQ